MSIRISIVDQIYAIYQKITSGLTTTSTQLPETLGTKTSANSLPVTLSSDGTFAQAIGTTADAAASTDTGTASHISLLKRLLSNITAGINLVNGGSAVSSSNPLPTVTQQGSAFFEAQKGRLFWGEVACPAVSAKYSTVQFFNPLDTAIDVSFAAMSAYVGAASRVRIVNMDTTLATEVTTRINNVRRGSGGRLFKVYTEAVDTLSDVALGYIQVAATTPTGAGLQLSGSFYTLAPNTGIAVQCETANTLLTIQFMANQVPTF